MNINVYQIAQDAIYEAKERIQKQIDEPKMKKMKVKGQFVTSEKQLYEMLEADLFDSDRYYELLEKFRDINKHNIEILPDLKQAIKYIDNILWSVRQDIYAEMKKEGLL